jgi:hypothetical protein
MLRIQRGYSKRKDMRMRGFEVDPESLGLIGFRAGVPNQVIQDRQEAKNPPAPKEEFPPRALEGSSALFRPFPGAGPDKFQ